MVELPISPQVGEMPGRAEGGAKERQPLACCAFANTQGVRFPLGDTLAGQRPPLSCRTSPPQGGRSANPHRPATTRATP